MSHQHVLKDTDRTIDDYFGKPSSLDDEVEFCWQLINATHDKYERLRQGCNDDWIKYVLEYRDDNKLPLVANNNCLEGAAMYCQWLLREAHYCRNRCRKS